MYSVIPTTEIVVILTIAAFLVFVLMRFIGRVSDRDNFKQTFVIGPEEDRSMVQLQVNIVLAGLALDFHAADLAERKALERVRDCGAGVGNIKGARSVVESLAACRSDVAVAKTAFWQAHGLARKFGFKVLSTYGFYVDRSLDEIEAHALILN